MLGCRAPPLAAVIIEPRVMASALVALESVVRHTPKATCIVWFVSTDNMPWVREQQIVHQLARQGRIELRSTPFPDHQW